MPDKSKKSKRSRSRSRSRDRKRSRKSRSRSRSRSSDRSHKKSKKDSPSRSSSSKKKTTAADEGRAAMMKAMAAMADGKKSNFSGAPTPLPIGGLPQKSITPEARPGVQPALLALGLPPQTPAQSLQQLARGAKRVYVGNVQVSISETMLREFLDHMITTAVVVPERQGPCHPQPVFTITINHPKMFAFVEFHTKTDCDIACCLDGAILNGESLRIRRPKDYNPPTEGPLAPVCSSPGLLGLRGEYYRYISVLSYLSFSDLITLTLLSTPFSPTKFSHFHFPLPR
jgi:splicing factor U2AF subunit